MAGLGIRVYTDEMISSALAAALRTRGYDALSCHEAGRSNQRITDPDQLAFATSEGRAILTENVRDYAPLDGQWKRQGKVHAGIMLYGDDPPIGELLRRVIAHLDAFTPEVQHDTVLWI